MSNNFPNKKFRGILYKFNHLSPMSLKIQLNELQEINLYITFGCHCFTEGFDITKHTIDYKYTFKNEIRAFNETRYKCSLDLPRIIKEKMITGKIYQLDKSYTYVSEIFLEENESYSIFFSLEKNKKSNDSSLIMFVKSAYIKKLVVGKDTPSWRFKGLAGIVSGVFEKRRKKDKPQKKKTP